MSDPLQDVLAAEAASRARVDDARERFENRLREARIDAARIRERNERRTREAIDRIERARIAHTLREIDRLETQTERQLSFDEPEVEKKIDRLVDSCLERFWPK